MVAAEKYCCCSSFSMKAYVVALIWQDTFNKYPQHMFSWRNEIKNYYMDIPFYRELWYTLIHYVIFHGEIRKTWAIHWLNKKVRFGAMGPLVQSIVSLTSSLVLVVKMLTVLVRTISHSQVFLLKKMCVELLTFFQQKYLIAYMPN